jgi:hypothetical protein
MTLLLPVLLESVPSFYVGGQFDAEVDQYSETAERTSEGMLHQIQSGTTPEVAATCDAMHIARDWTRAFDSALRRRDSKTLLALFSDDVSIKATVHDSDGVLTTLDIDRDQFVQSTVSSMKSLSHYQQKRLTLIATVADEPAAESCSTIKVESSVVESGMLQTKRYHIESTETYILKRRAGTWVAVSGETVEH